MKKALLIGLGLLTLSLSACQNMNQGNMDPDTLARLQRNESENEMRH